MDAKKTLFILPYIPCIAWVQHALTSDLIYLEAHENYTKQSYRNRTHILSANGLLALNIPVLKKEHKQLITQIQTDPNENWKRQHWHSIQSAYNKSAFFMTRTSGTQFNSLHIYEFSSIPANNNIIFVILLKEFNSIVSNSFA